MTSGQISRAKAFLKELKPNVLKLASQNNEVVRAWRTSPPGSGSRTSAPTTASRTRAGPS